MSSSSEQFIAYGYQYYGRTIHTQQVYRGQDQSLFTTIVSSGSPYQHCCSTIASTQGEVTIRHEFLPSRFIAYPDVLFIQCSEPCSVTQHGDLLSLSSPNRALFSTTPPANYGAHIVALPPTDIVSGQSHQLTECAGDDSRTSGTLFAGYPGYTPPDAQRRHSYPAGDKAGTPQLSGPASGYGGRVEDY